jgi:hypothetical protein
MWAVRRFLVVVAAGAIAMSCFVAGTAAGATPDPTSCVEATYCGGPVLSSVEVVPIFWTAQVPAATVQWAPGYLKALVDSPLFDMLSEYSTAGKTGIACGLETDAGLEFVGPATPFSTGQTITRGTAVGGIVISPMLSLSNAITDDFAAIGLELEAQITHGLLPAPTYDAQGYPQTLYMVFFPPDVTITLQGATSCKGFGAYHYSAPYEGTSCVGQYLPYAVIPSCNPQGAQLSGVVSHELTEAVSDADVGPTSPTNANYGDVAWYLGPTCTGSSCGACGEIADVCAYRGDATVPGTTIQSQYAWSQTQDSCAVSNPAVGPQPAPTGPSILQCAENDGGSAKDSGAGGAEAGVAEAGGANDGGDGAEDAGSDAGLGSVDGSDASGDAASGNGGAARSSGCGCAAIGSRDSHASAAMAALAGLAWIRRRRERRTSTRASDRRRRD